MTAIDLVELSLTCGSWQEAQQIADDLLEKHLVACVEFFEIKSKHWWEGKLDEAKEVKLLMQTAKHLFAKVEEEVKKRHSYDTFVLQAVPVTDTSKKAEDWLGREIKG